ncbi:hypothetical protein MLD38_015344 [Melastoma candidum]|uniref:Uncharacterized protein n=1 Tax=Melastoma candidum TaxID=119954 RepID=A0ACB9RIW5_9MYRT|nr:hypothetical protein MLD38_015344 [Melastoma candidum]
MHGLSPTVSTPTSAPDVTPLPSSVERLLRDICVAQNQLPADRPARQALSLLGEEAAVNLLTTISRCTIKRSLSAYILFMFPKRSKQARCSSDSSPSVARYGARTFSSPPPPHEMSPPSRSLDEFLPLQLESGSGEGISAQLRALNELEFRKAFLILSYIGEKKLEDVFTADDIRQLRDFKMIDFEAQVWSSCCLGSVKRENRQQYADWDLGRTHIYHCHVSGDGSCSFKGPFLSQTRTLLQKQLGDENVLLVKLAQDENCHDNAAVGSRGSLDSFREIAKKGICIGLRRFQFFVFKDGGKEEKKRDPTSSPVKCYFVCLEHSKVAANRTIQQARSLFMHAHTVSSISCYMIRFSLILSKTITLDIDLSKVNILKEDDVRCKGEMGNDLFDETGKPLIHTDGTGYVSLDIALRCPGNVFKGICRTEEIIEKFRAGNVPELNLEYSVTEPPLLIQFRMFFRGSAVKGTFLVNKNLEKNTIVIRPSMIKVEEDPRLAGLETVNSLEIVTTSNKPKAAYLSRTLIALLNYGGVPDKFFSELVENALGDDKVVLKKKRAALRVLVSYGDMDAFIGARMLLSGIPLDEPYLQMYLSSLMKRGRRLLSVGRIPISDSYYLMGTADPTGKLRSDEVCIILDNGQISGDVLVYRNPGLHFGDIHVLKAKYVEELESVVGNSKYAIFFPVSGPRSLADEMGSGDFDGDMYWISRNPQLLKYFKPNKPWISASTPSSLQCVKPSDLSDDELENNLIDLWLTTRFQPSYTVGTAADSWQALMDRLLVLGPDCADERSRLEKNLCQLVDIYYNALDAPKKSGTKIEVPQHLKAQVFPHYMGKDPAFSYSSSSILGSIYDSVMSYQTEDLPTEEITKLPCFTVDVPEECMRVWQQNYKDYRQEMTVALDQRGKGTDDLPDEVIKKYKQLLYGAAEFEDSPRKLEDIFNDAVAIYNVTYDHARQWGRTGSCGFAWKVAGTPLCMLYRFRERERSISVLKEIF